MSELGLKKKTVLSTLWTTWDTFSSFPVLPQFYHSHRQRLELKELTASVPPAHPCRVCPNLEPEAVPQGFEHPLKVSAKC